MSATFIVNNGTVTVQFQYTALTAKAQAAVTWCAKYLWEHGYGDHGTEETPILFTDLTNQEKLDLVDEHLHNVILDAAWTQYNAEKVETAKDEGATEFINLVALGE